MGRMRQTIGERVAPWPLTLMSRVRLLGAGYTEFTDLDIHFHIVELLRLTDVSYRREAGDAGTRSPGSPPLSHP